MLNIVYESKIDVPIRYWFAETGCPIKQVEYEGGEITNEENAYNIRSFEQMMEEAHILWAKVVEQGKVG